jgi:hypothetical protein
VGPFIMMGSTDSAVVRPLGVHAYGIAPFVLKEADLRGMQAWPAGGLAGWWLRRGRCRVDR